MENNFDRYINQLQSIENSENVATLKALCDINSPVLSFFPAIIGGLNNLLSSGNVTEKVVSEISNKLPKLSRCKSAYSRLQSSAKSQFYANAINALLVRKGSLSLYEVEVYETELMEMILNNEAQLKEERDEEYRLKSAKEAEERARVSMKPTVSVTNFRSHDTYNVKLFKTKHDLRFSFDVSTCNLQNKNILIKMVSYDCSGVAFVEPLVVRQIPTKSQETISTWYTLNYERTHRQGKTTVRLQVDVIDESTQQLLCSQTYVHNILV